MKCAEFCVLTLLSLCLSTPVMPQLLPDQPIQYTLSFPDATHHYVEVEAGGR